ncbi:MAG: nucleoside triphosphate pyrophosphohydrolase [Hellea sp.]|nr:nucleoside triphosphate pyrophosphohydrolase [Hellea sp.]
MKILRSEQGCPWDKEQNFETIAPYTIEEAYEVREAIAQNDLSALKEELGDLLFQVVFHAQMAEEISAFSLEDVCDGLTSKMVRRHPHVFGAGDKRSAAEQKQAWETLKAKERRNKDHSKSLLDDVPLALPALMRADKLQKRAARVGFDWPDLEGVLGKIEEEKSELLETLQDGSYEQQEGEMGDLIFAVTNLARKLNIDPEKALRRTNDKFIERFQYIERKSKASKIELEDMTLSEMEKLWQKAKIA